MSTIVMLLHHSVKSQCLGHVTQMKPSDWLLVCTILCRLMGTTCYLVAREMQSTMMAAEAVLVVFKLLSCSKPVLASHLLAN